MAKMINLVQGDFGIIIKVSLLNEEGETFEILDGDAVKAHLQKPDGKCEEFNPAYLTIVEPLNGIVRLSIPAEYTEQEGYHEIYIEVSNTSYSINAKKSIPYYVNKRHNVGAH